MRETLAYVMFVMVVCVLHTYAVRHSKDYGNRLQRIRRVCNEVAGGETPTEDDGIRVFVVDTTNGKIIGDHDENDKIVWLRANDLRSNVLSFEHIPDLTGVFTHNVAIMKINGADTACVAYAST